MDTWAPLFGKIVDSSLWDQPDHVVKVFITMMAKKDSDHIVRANAYNIARWSRKTESEVLDALRILSNPDGNRMEPQAHDGRRIARVEGGWLILNGQYYEDLMREVNRRVYKARKERERRAKMRSAQGPLTGEASYLMAEQSGASEAQKSAISEIRKNGS